MKPIYEDYVQFEAPGSDTRPTTRWPLAKWASVKDRLDAPSLPYVHIASWLAIASMNAQVNHWIRYVSDLTDHWQTPEETSELCTGDCEDFAIYKLAALKKAGFAYDNMCLMLGEIASLTRNQPHAYLIVELDGEQRVLDSKFDQLIKPSEYINWHPLKAIINDKVYLFSKPIRLSDQQA